MIQIFESMSCTYTEEDLTFMRYKLASVDVDSLRLPLESPRNLAHVSVIHDYGSVNRYIPVYTDEQGRRRILSPRRSAALRRELVSPRRSQSLHANIFTPRVDRSQLLGRELCNPEETPFNSSVFGPHVDNLSLEHNQFGSHTFDPDIGRASSSHDESGGLSANMYTNRRFTYCHGDFWGWDSLDWRMFACGLYSRSGRRSRSLPSETRERSQEVLVDVSKIPWQIAQQPQCQTRAEILTDARKHSRDVDDTSGSKSSEDMEYRWDLDPDDSGQDDADMDVDVAQSSSSKSAEMLAKEFWKEQYWHDAAAKVMNAPKFVWGPEDDNPYDWHLDPDEHAERDVKSQSERCSPPNSPRDSEFGLGDWQLSMDALLDSTESPVVESDLAKQMDVLQTKLECWKDRVEKILADVGTIATPKQHSLVCKATAFLFWHWYVESKLKRQGKARQTSEQSNPNAPDSS